MIILILKDMLQIYKGDIHSHQYVRLQLELLSIFKTGYDFSGSALSQLVNSEFTNEYEKRNSMNMFKRLWYDMKLKADFTGKVSDLIKEGYEKNEPKLISMVLVKSKVNEVNMVLFFTRIRNIFIELSSFQLANLSNYQYNPTSSVISIVALFSLFGVESVLLFLITLSLQVFH